MNGVVGLRLERGVSVKPSGDLVTVEVLNRSRFELMRLLDSHGVGRAEGTSLTTSELSSIASASFSQLLTRDSSEATWEEMEMMTAKESNMTINALIIMLIAGFVAVAGIATGALHLVIAAMVIAPGFEPLTRIALGIIAGSAAWRRGASDFIRGYFMLIVGAFTAALILPHVGTVLTGSNSSYLPSHSLLSYWTNITATSLGVSALASVAGAVLVASNRSVLTAGVMIALALVPTAALAGMACASLDWSLLAASFGRLAIEVTLVVIGSVVVLGIKRVLLHRRGTTL